ncbi:MAG: ComF family protein [Bacteroidota bacterium]
MERTNFHLHPTDNELFYRLGGKVPLEGAYALFYYDKAGRLQRLMTALKYQQAPLLGIRLGELLGKSLKESADLNTFDAIVPVPLHWTRMARRGYNQASYIGKGISMALNCPTIEGKLVRRNRTAVQAQKKGMSRWANVSQAFQCKGTMPSHVLLIDDVITTGATLEACIRAILMNSPKTKVSIACLGMTRRH